MFTVRVTERATDGQEQLLGDGTGKTASGAITSAGRAIKNARPTGTVVIRLMEGDSGIFTAFGDTIATALYEAREMNRKSRACGGR